MKKVQFFVEGQPVPQAAISFSPQGRGYHSNGKRLKPWRALVRARADEAMRRRKGLWEGTVGIRMQFFLPRGKTITRKHPHVRPDLQHLVRAVEDALTGAVYVDDSQIVEAIATKEYATTEDDVGVDITVWTIK